MPTYTTTTSDGIEIYSGRSERAARKAAREDRGYVDRPVTIRKNGERIGAYVPRQGKRGLWLT